MSTQRRASRGGRPTRTVSARSLEPSLLVFVEGERTEVDYLTHWHREHRSTVNVQIDRRTGRDPRSLVAHAVDTKRREVREARRGRGSAHDEYWCVFDVDQHQTLDAAIEMASANGIEIALSNPCIELWLLLHFREQSAWLDRHAAQRAFCAEAGLAGKGLPRETVETLAAEFETAKRRAQALAARHVGDGNPARHNPSSDVWRIVDAICR